MENTLLAEQWISQEDVARMLNLDKRYAGMSIRKGYLKGRIAYRGVSGRHFQYLKSDVDKILELATIPARKS